MFGYVMPYKPELKIKEYDYYRSVYCGLCKSLKNNFGNLSRFLLNYDFVFLYLIINDKIKNYEYFKKESCIVHPTKRKVILVDNTLLEYTSYNLILLSYFKLYDDIIDDRQYVLYPIINILKKLIYDSNFYDTEKYNFIKNCIENQMNLEKIKCNRIDEISHYFSEILKLIFSYNNDVKLGQIGYFLGKWVYLIDAIDDFFDDLSKKRYNVLKYHFSDINNFEYIKSEMEILKISLLNYINEMKLQIDFELSPLVENIIDVGLYKKTIDVLDNFLNKYKELINNERSI
ncbi:DUF5685 family protein [Caldicellulosiruptoraceae bacterium PP1]